MLFNDMVNKYLYFYISSVINTTFVLENKPKFESLAYYYILVLWVIQYIIVGCSNSFKLYY